MKINFSKKDITVAVLMLGAIIVLSAVIAPFFNPPKEVEALNRQIAQNASSAMSSHSLTPTSLRIPTLNVNAKVQALGITTSNTIMAPTKPDEVAWFKLGAKPGEKGTAIISGHVDWVGGLPAVFEKLADLQPADDIFIDGIKTFTSTSTSENTSATTSTSATTTLHYKISGVETVNYSDNHVIDAALTQKDTSEIILITCYGTWMSEDKTFDKRLVVRAQLQN